MRREHGGPWRRAGERRRPAAPDRLGPGPPLRRAGGECRGAGADRGLGVLVNLARGSLFDIPLMFATLITIALLGIALYLVVVVLERRLVGVR